MMDSVKKALERLKFLIEDATKDLSIIPEIHKEKHYINSLIADKKLIEDAFREFYVNNEKIKQWRNQIISNLRSIESKMSSQKNTSIEIFQHQIFAIASEMDEYIENQKR